MITIIDIFGWSGAFLLATCGLPQLIKTIKTRSFDGLSFLFLVWWLAGEILTVTYIFYTAFRLPLIFNYTFNIIVVTIILILYFISWRKNKKNKKRTN